PTKSNNGPPFLTVRSRDPVRVAREQVTHSRSTLFCGLGRRISPAVEFSLATQRIYLTGIKEPTLMGPVQPHMANRRRAAAGFRRGIEESGRYTHSTPAPAISLVATGVRLRASVLRWD